MAAANGEDTGNEKLVGAAVRPRMGQVNLFGKLNKCATALEVTFISALLTEHVGSV